MSKIRVKQIDETELSGYIEQVSSGDLSDIRADISALETGQDTLSGFYTDLTYSVGVISGQNVGISGRLNAIESDFALFDVDISTLSGDIVNLQIKTGVLYDYTESVENDLISFESGVNVALSGISGSLSGSSSGLNAYISGVSGQVSGISGTVTGITGSISGINTTLSNLSGSINSLSGDVSNISGHINTFSGLNSGYIYNYILVQDVKSSGVGGGSFTGAGAWKTRDINTEVSDSGNLCSISSNQLTLSGGLYSCDISAPAMCVGSHMARLRNISNTTTLLSGTMEYAGTSGIPVSNRSLIKGRFMITGITGQLLEIQHLCQNTCLNSGFGTGSNLPESSLKNIYTIAEFQRISS